MFTLMVVALLISFIVIEPTSAIQCCNCESVSDNNCGEEFSMEEYFKVDCDHVAPPRFLSNEFEYSNATACMKKIYREYKILKYVRSCYFGDVNDTKVGCRMDPTMMDFQDVQCFVCNDINFCNKASSIKVMKSSITKYLMFLTIIIIAPILFLH